MGKRFVNERSDCKYLKLQKMEFDRILLRKEYAHIESLIDENILVLIINFLKINIVTNIDTIINIVKQTIFNKFNIKSIDMKSK